MNKENITLNYFNGIDQIDITEIKGIEKLVGISYTLKCNLLQFLPFILWFCNKNVLNISLYCIVKSSNEVLICWSLHKLLIRYLLIYMYMYSNDSKYLALMHTNEDRFLWPRSFSFYLNNIIVLPSENVEKKYRSAVRAA